MDEQCLHTARTDVIEWRQPPPFQIPVHQLDPLKLLLSTVKLKYRTYIAHLQKRLLRLSTTDTMHCLVCFLPLSL